MRAMFRNPRNISTALALLIALRTFVPAGYMLALPSSDDPFGFAIVLCPTQNPTLDLSLLTSSGQPHVHHHHGEHDDVDDTISFGSGCGIWLNSVSLAFESAPIDLAIAANFEHYEFAADTLFIRRPPRGHSFSRAPPILA